MSELKSQDSNKNEKHKEKQVRVVGSEVILWVGPGENMAFPKGDPTEFTVDPGQEMEETVIMTVEKVPVLKLEVACAMNFFYPF